LRREGNILNIASVSAYLPLSRVVAYSAAKAAVLSVTQFLAGEWAPRGVRVDSLTPGFFPAEQNRRLPVDKLCFCLVVEGTELAGLYAGTPEAAWDQASDLTRRLHIVRKERAFHTVLSCAPPMSDELWAGGKCMYKLEPVVADGGELIIYAPHIREVSGTHGLRRDGQARVRWRRRSRIRHTGAR
jgi:NAD(P)-dependent dehydrogenase (short-subunit alcohol dehydrogenase family)